MKKLLILFLLSFLLLFEGCGYRPNAKFSREVVGEKISTNVIISQQDPDNSVIIKDAVDTAVIEVFKASLVSQENADTHLTISVSNPQYRPVVYDEHGYVVGYRMKVDLYIKRETKNKSLKNYVTHGQYDFSIEAQSIITDQQRYESINVAAQRAIRAFLAQVSAEGARVKE